ncbi:MAG TPA: hypothetical protein VFN27_12680 [Xanthobacteraceae bacterium]|nr:hypothetical protein [Xanthobacteraceae bacterium]
MRTFASLAAAAFAVVAAAPVANAQALVAQAYQTLIVQPGATVIRETPLFAVSAGQPVQIISTVETVRTIRPTMRPLRHHVVASRKTQDRVALNYGRPLYNMAAEPVVQTAVAAPVAQTVATPLVSSGVGPELSGQFQCIAGCAGGIVGPAFVTQNGWDLNLVNEIGQPSRAWIDYPGHIWVQSWNEGAVYSTDGMTIQFDNGTVWAKNVVLLVPQYR